MSDDSPSGTTTTVNNTNTEPWSGQEGSFRNLYAEAGALASGAPTIDQTAYLNANPDVASQVAVGNFGGALDYLRNRPQAEQNLAFNQFGRPTNQPQFFPDQTFVDHSPESSAALDLTTLRALEGSPVNQAAADNLTGTLQGDYLNQGNPWLGNVFDSIQNRVQPAVDSQFAAHNRTGSGAHQEMMTRSLADYFAPHAFANYENERNRQTTGIQQAPGVAAQDYGDFATLRGVGQEREQQSARQLQDSMSRFEYEQNEPLRRLQQMQSFTGGGGFSQGQSTAQTPFYSQSPWLDAAGIGLGIAGIAGTSGIFG